VGQFLYGRFCHVSNTLLSVSSRLLKIAWAIALGANDRAARHIPVSALCAYLCGPYREDSLKSTLWPFQHPAVGARVQSA
ncbi:hypothetical protein, partial [uncultured Alcanivorax sp.]|uniref:hypothetical protein n=1 Tax=uncultured Alcanivorax sp. TaxID=191215 RepID=UPI0032B21019